MNQIIEELKNEDGRYKVRKVSDDIIVIKYKIPIFATTNNNSVVVISSLKIRLKYKRLDSTDIYNLVPIRKRFYELFSQNWSIKKGRILTQRKSGLINIDGYLINGIYVGIILDDISWYRDYKINKLLENEK